ncbi:ATP-binding protein [Candidimonas nitroreducens]|uniref:histidine kinase n=1 Tax=Candidimonas nitroreducens TaxID=683354 RepID=A0A225M9U5_9BURK|nr:ATP-binding protein [Candidimonas nitroreducens]OWT57502.1 histidine kinase [Candidimonas nitroreducens]
MSIAKTDTPAAPHGAVAPAPAWPSGGRLLADRGSDRRGIDNTGHKNMQQLIQLRWIAVLGQLVTISVVYQGFHIHLPLVRMLAVLGCLVLFNAASTLRLRLRQEVANGELFAALLVDVGMLTAQLYLSGGITNPFVFLYLLQVTLGAMLLESWSIWILVAAAAGCIGGLALKAPPLSLRLDHDSAMASVYIQGMLVCFAINAVLLVVFVSRISRNLRARDAHLADLRQRAAEEEHIVRMGLLASGAAHELGTPLATLAVILGDWRRMPAFAGDPELVLEIGEMQSQVLRCKSIVGSILLAAGEARGEAPVETTVCVFLDDLVAEWRATRPGAMPILDYRNDFGQDLRIISDSALKQMICNVLDNALEASPEYVGLRASRDGAELCLDITDRGLGFAPAMLEQVGKPYQSSKGRPGGGLGLFLVVNVARTLGGRVRAANLPEGGAKVSLALPLASLTPDDENEEALDAS